MSAANDAGTMESWTLVHTNTEEDWETVENPSVSSSLSALQPPSPQQQQQEQEQEVEQELEQELQQELQQEQEQELQQEQEQELQPEPEQEQQPEQEQPKLNYAKAVSRNIPGSAASASSSAACPACSYDNHPDLVSCEMCGSKLVGGRGINMAILEAAEEAEAEAAAAAAAVVEALKESEAVSQKKCPACTFLNHCELRNCEVCNAKLEDIKQTDDTVVDAAAEEDPVDDYAMKRLAQQYRDVVLRT